MDSCVNLHPPDDPGYEAIRKNAARYGATLVSVPDRGPWDWRVITELLAVCRPRDGGATLRAGPERGGIQPQEPDGDRLSDHKPGSKLVTAQSPGDAAYSAEQGSHYDRLMRRGAESES